MKVSVKNLKGNGEVGATLAVGARSPPVTVGLGEEGSWKRE